MRACNSTFTLVSNLTIMTPSTVIPKPNKLRKARYFDGVLDLDPVSHEQEAKRPSTLCTDTWFWRMKSFSFTQGCIFEPTVAMTGSTERILDFPCRCSPMPSLTLVRRIADALIQWFRWSRIESSWVQIWPVSVVPTSRQLNSRGRYTHWGHNFSKYN